MDMHGEVGIRVRCGIPVIELRGAWMRQSADRVGETIRQLASAGHLEIVLNVQRAAVHASCALDPLWAAARWVKSRHGRMEIVATVEQADRLLHAIETGLIGVSSSEDRAIGRIKGTPIRTHEPCCTARLSA